MELVIMYLVAIAAVGIVGFMLVKKMDIKISLFLIGIVLMYIALLMGKDISFTDFVSSGVTWLDPFKVVGDQFVSTLTSAGFIILILGGAHDYGSHGLKCLMGLRPAGNPNPVMLRGAGRGTRAGRDPERHETGQGTFSCT